MITLNNPVLFNVRIVEQGDKYGREMCLTHEDERPLVEFYDSKFAHTEYGQFVSRYFVFTLLEDFPDDVRGLSLDGGIPEWTVERQSYLNILQHLNVYSLGLITAAQFNGVMLPVG